MADVQKTGVGAAGPKTYVQCHSLYAHNSAAFQSFGWSYMFAGTFLTQRTSCCQVDPGPKRVQGSYVVLCVTRRGTADSTAWQRTYRMTASRSADLSAVHDFLLCASIKQCSRSARVLSFFACICPSLICLAEHHVQIDQGWDRGLRFARDLQ